MTSVAKPPHVRATSRIVAGLLALCVVFLGGGAHAQSTIRVLVNEEPITSFDIKQRTRMLAVFTQGKQGEQAAIDQLIEERLMLQEAKHRSVEVSDAEVDDELANRARAAKMTAEQFTQAMRQVGIDVKTFKDFLRANVAWQRVVRARFRATVEITDQDVAAALSRREPAEGEQQQTVFEYRIQQILFVIPEGAGSGIEAKRRSEANAFRGAFTGCENSLQQAAGTPGIVVQPEVRRESGQIAGALKEALAKLEVGSITEPERVPQGIQIVGICAKNPIAGQTEATSEVRQQLSSERGQLLARRYLRDLRSDAVIEYK